MGLDVTGTPFLSQSLVKNKSKEPQRLVNSLEMLIISLHVDDGGNKPYVTCTGGETMNWFRY